MKTTLRWTLSVGLALTSGLYRPRSYRSGCFFGNKSGDYDSRAQLCRSGDEILHYTADGAEHERPTVRRGPRIVAARAAASLR